MKKQLKSKKPKQKKEIIDNKAGHKDAKTTIELYCSTLKSNG